MGAGNWAELSDRLSNILASFSYDIREEIGEKQSAFFGHLMLRHSLLTITRTRPHTHTHTLSLSLSPSLSHTHTHRERERQRHRQRDRDETYRQADKQTNRQKNTSTHTHRQAGRQARRHARTHARTHPPPPPHTHTHLGEMALSIPKLRIHPTLETEEKNRTSLLWRKACTRQ